MQTRKVRTLGSLLATTALLLAATGASAQTIGDDSKLPADVPAPSQDHPNIDVTPGQPVDYSAPVPAVSERDLYRDNLLNPTFDVLSELPGFQAGGLEADRDEIVVYWHGDFGPKAQAAVDEANSRGVPVNVHFVRYPYDELRKIASRLVAAIEAKGIEVQGHEIGNPFDVISIWGDSLDRSADARQIAQSVAADVLPPDLTLAIVDSPGEAIPFVGSRHNDNGQPTPGGAFRAYYRNRPAVYERTGVVQPW